MLSVVESPHIMETLNLAVAINIHICWEMFEQLGNRNRSGLETIRIRFDGTASARSSETSTNVNIID